MWPSSLSPWLVSISAVLRISSSSSPPRWPKPPTSPPPSTPTFISACSRLALHCKLGIYLIELRARLIIFCLQFNILYYLSSKVRKKNEDHSPLSSCHQGYNYWPTWLRERNCFWPDFKKFWPKALVQWRHSERPYQQRQWYATLAVTRDSSLYAFLWFLEFGKKIQPIVAAGQLVPFELLAPLMEYEIEQTEGGGWLLDGKTYSLDSTHSNLSSRSFMCNISIIQVTQEV